MTQCTNGTRAQSGAPAYFWFTWSAFIAWLAIKFARLGTIVWAFFGDVPFNVADYCASEITIPSAPSTADWLGFFTFDFAARVKVEQYLIASFKAYLWDSYCECIPLSAGTCQYDLPTTAQPSSNALPAGHRRGVEMYAKTTGLGIYGGRCYFAAVGGGTFNLRWSDQHAGTTGVQSFTGLVGTHDYFFTTPPLMTNVSSGFIYDLVWEFPNSGYDITYNGVSEMPVDTTKIHYNKLIYQSDMTSGMGELFNQTLPLCPIICQGGGPSGTPIDYVPPEPADPTDIPDHPEVTCSTTADLCSRMNALQSAILMTRRDIDWLQAQTAPTCWVAGTPHTGLTGAGTIAVADVVGAYVTMSVPSIWGRTNETPARTIPKAGELQFAVDGVVVDDHQLHYDAEQILGAPAAANSIVYNFRLGVTGTITPLQRCK